jgi:ParB/RepB/Spo0J family partition protein
MPKPMPISEAAPTGANNPAALSITELDITLLESNSWNPNRMDEPTMHKLTEYIRKEGLVQPIVVRPKGDRFEILGGFHRWTVCKDRLGFKTIPCIVMEGLDDKRAKVLSVNLNELKGQSVPALLSELLHDLNKESALDDLATMLPYTLAQMQDALELLKLPDGLEEMIEEQARKEEEAAPVIVTIVFDKAQAETFEAACTKASRDLGAVKNAKGRAVEAMAKAFLGSPEAAAETPAGE